MPNRLLKSLKAAAKRVSRSRRRVAPANVNTHVQQQPDNINHNPVNNRHNQVARLSNSIRRRASLRRRQAAAANNAARQAEHAEAERERARLARSHPAAPNPARHHEITQQIMAATAAIQESAAAADESYRPAPLLPRRHAAAGAEGYYADFGVASPAAAEPTTPAELMHQVNRTPYENVPGSTPKTRNNTVFSPASYRRGLNSSPGKRTQKRPKQLPPKPPGPEFN